MNGLKANLQTVPFLEVRKTSTDLVCTWTHFRGPGLRRDVRTSLVLRGTLARELLREMVGRRSMTTLPVGGKLAGELLREIDDNVAPSPISELLRQWAD